MVARRLFFLAPLLMASAVTWAAPSPDGLWKTVDDRSGRVKAVVRIERGGDTLGGVIERLFRLPDEVQDPVCKACEGDRKDKRIVGMTILWGMHPARKGWEGGSILDPENGKVYSCKLSLSPDGQSLIVRGYLGFSWLGRSQTWKRFQEGGDIR